jgi:hypothetical protein
LAKLSHEPPPHRSSLMHVLLAVADRKFSILA